MQCPNCSATVADNMLQCPKCSALVGLLVRTSGGEQYGPYTLESVRQYIADGRIQPDDCQACISTGAWASLRDTLGPLGADIPAPPPGLAGAGPPAPSPPPAPAATTPQGEWWAKQVPYRNAAALSAYYVGVFSFVPCLGLPLAVVAIPLGIVGLKRARAHPQVYGRHHAWTAIVLGALSLLGHAAAIVYFSLQ